MMSKILSNKKNKMYPCKVISYSSFLYYALIVSLFLCACKKFVDIPSPDNKLTSDNVYSSDATASGVLTGMYSYMSSGTRPFAAGLNSISVQAGLSADELVAFTGSSPALVAQYQNSLSNQIAPPFWGNLYFFLHNINLAIEGITLSTSLTPVVRQQLLGEAKFMRAFAHFYLVNLYGDIPLITSSDYKMISLLDRAPKSQVYEQIIADLKEAGGLLTDKYVGVDAKTITSERARPNKWVEAALLARVYLYQKKYDSAEIQASAVINNKTLYDTVSLSNVFLKNSKEALWQLPPVLPNTNTLDANLFILPSAGPNATAYPVYLSNIFLKSFDSGDQRKTNWVKSVTVNGTEYYYPNKYKVANSGTVSEYLMVLRLAEVYLIRAEAKAQQGNISDALSDLNIIRKRAGLPNIVTTNKDSVIAAILHERQVELFTEWGHRWLDLKRTNNIDAIMNAVSPLKGGNWNSNWQLYPIPLTDLQADPYLKQNPGY